MSVRGKRRLERQVWVVGMLSFFASRIGGGLCARRAMLGVAGGASTAAAAAAWWPQEQALCLASDTPTPNLAGKVALVTGGTGSIGFAVAQQLADAGCHVALVDLNEERCQQMAARLPTRSIGIAMDVASEPAVTAGVARVTDALGGVDILVNVAGVLSNNKAFETSAEEWRKVHAVSECASLLNPWPQGPCLSSCLALPLADSEVTCLRRLRQLLLLEQSMHAAYGGAGVGACNKPLFVGMEERRPHCWHRLLGLQSGHGRPHVLPGSTVCSRWRDCKRPLPPQTVHTHPPPASTPATHPAYPTPVGKRRRAMLRVLAYDYGAIDC